MKRKLIPVSPPHLIDSIFIASMLLVSLIAIVVADIIIEDCLAWPLYLSWGVFTICLGWAFAISYRGVIVTRIDDVKATSFFIKKKCCEMDFQDVQYISLVYSFNYGRDTNTAYIVLSKEDIKGKNLALSFSPKKQIVIRVSCKNYLWLKNALQPLSLQNYLLGHFKDFHQMVVKRSINLKRIDSENGFAWEFVK